MAKTLVTKVETQIKHRDRSYVLSLVHMLTLTGVGFNCYGKDAS